MQLLRLASIRTIRVTPFLTLEVLQFCCHRCRHSQYSRHSRVTGVTGATGVRDAPSEMSAQHMPNRETVLRGVALRRMGLPDDNADVVLFLASDQSRWITGQVIAADGGQVAAATVLRTL